MTLDKKTWQQAMHHYQEWNEAKLLEEISAAGQTTPADKWKQYLQLYALGRSIKAEPSIWEQQQIAEEWEAYYSAIRTLEEWRKRHGRTS